MLEPELLLIATRRDPSRSWGYYLGLNSKQRELFNEKVMRRSFASIAMEERSALDLPVILQEEMDTYMKLSFSRCLKCFWCFYCSAALDICSLKV